MSVREATTYRGDVATKLSNPMIPGVRKCVSALMTDWGCLSCAANWSVCCSGGLMVQQHCEAGLHTSGLT
jgi:hypothetical protein